MLTSRCAKSSASARSRACDPFWFVLGLFLVVSLTCSKVTCGGHSCPLDYLPLPNAADILGSTTAECCQADPIHPWQLIALLVDS